MEKISGPKVSSCWMKSLSARRGPLQFLSSSCGGLAFTKIVIIAVAILWMGAVPRGRALVTSETVASAFQCPMGFFSFGTSLQDTGSGPYALPGQLDSERPPYGNTFFGCNALRFSDGRLVVDFFSLAFGFPLLTAYFQSIAPDFSYGVNFAVDGATAIAEAPVVPFDLDRQVAQFSSFKLFAQAAKQNPDIPRQYKKSLPKNTIFTKGLYTLAFGRNDLTFAYIIDRITPSTANATIVPQIVKSIARGIQNLYDDGARNFLIFNVPPQGCSPEYLTQFGPLASKADYDEYGCLIPYNQVIQSLNNQTHTAIEELRMSLNDTLILEFDYYKSFVAVLQNPQSFGITNTLDACCGVGDQHNYNQLVPCSRTGILHNVTVSAESCNNPSEHISWDGIHFTDAFNRFTAELLLTGRFLEPPINMKQDCGLDFSKFTGVNFTQAYPHGYIVGPPNL